MSSIVPRIDPREFIRRFRANYVNLYRLWRLTGQPPPGVQVDTPREHPLALADLPEQIRQAISEYLKRTAPRRITVVKHLRLIDGEPSLVVEDAEELPPEDRVVTASQTVTVNAVDHAWVMTDLYVIRLE